MKILVVDDSRFAQRLLGKMLKERFNEADIQYASTGEEGYKLYQSFRPNFIITDLLMPVIDGKVLIKLIRHEDQEIKIIVLSADVQKTVKQEVEELGISLFLNKPIDKERMGLLVDVLKEG